MVNTARGAELGCLREGSVGCLLRPGGGGEGKGELGSTDEGGYGTRQQVAVGKGTDIVTLTDRVRHLS